MSTCCKGLDVLLDQNRRKNAVVIEEENVIGAVVGAGAQAKQYLVMHIENPQGLVAKEKGAGLAWATNLLVPEFIENTIYSKVADELKKQFSEKGSEVSVQVVSAPPKGEKPTSDLKGGIFMGLLLAALGYGAVKLVTR